jgi:hypothetical protein
VPGRLQRGCPERLTRLAGKVEEPAALLQSHLPRGPSRRPRRRAALPWRSGEARTMKALVTEEEDLAPLFALHLCDLLGRGALLPRHDLELDTLTLS